MSENMNDDNQDALNPYVATVVGFVDNNGVLQSAIPEKPFSLLINLGELDNVQNGQKVIVFALGPKVIDPETSESLGHFEVVRGEGRVSNTQTRMSIIISSRKVTE